MISPQLFVSSWIEYAVAGTILLMVVKLAVDRIRQPADRIHLIVLGISITAFVPLLASLASVSSWRLGLITEGTSVADEISETTQPLPGSEPLVPARERFDEPLQTDPNPDVQFIPPSNTFVIPKSSEPKRQANVWWYAAMTLALSYGVAIALILAQSFVGGFQLWRISKRARPADSALEDTWMRITEGLGGRVRVRISDQITAPLAYGCWWPTVLIPESVATGESVGLQYCLAHEWSHIKRGDLRAWQLTGACQILLWFQPLFWMLRRELRACQDFRADYDATDEGRDRIEYAELLLVFARQQMRRPIAGTIAFASRSSQLARRIRMLLDPQQRLRYRSSLTFCLITGSLLLGGALLFGTVRLGAVHATEAAPAVVLEAVQGVADGTDETNVRIVRGRVVNAEGVPVAAAQLWLPLQISTRNTVHAVSDEAGNFELHVPVDWIRSALKGGSSLIWAHAPGSSIATQQAYKALTSTSQPDLEIRLPSPSHTRFRVLTPQGQALPDVLVQPVNYKTSVAFSQVPEELRAVVSARTDNNGTATLLAIDPGLLFLVQVVSDEFGRQTIRVDRNTEAGVREIQLRPTGSIKGRLVGERSEWLKGVRLGFETDSRDEWSDTDGIAETITDDEGHFEVPTIASGVLVRTYVALDPALPVRHRINKSFYVTPGETLHMEIPLESAPWVSGKVLAKSNGQPVANAEISLDYGFRQSSRVTTDAQGSYKGRALAGPVRVQIISMPDSYVQLGAPWETFYEVPSDIDEFALPTLEVVGTHELAGQLLDSAGQPLPNTQVLACESNRRYGFATTDSQGRFSMRVPNGVETRIDVYIDKRGQEPTTIVERDPLMVRFSNAPREQERPEIRSSLPDVVLTGRVRSGGVPIAGITLILKRGIPAQTAISGDASTTQRQTVTQYRDVGRALTDTNGVYRLTGLKAGDDYQIKVKPPFLAADPTWRHQVPGTSHLSSKARGDVVLPDVNLRRLNQSLSGIVVDREGTPVEGAHVTVQLRDSGQTIHQLTTSSSPPRADSDHEGRFHLTHLPDEPLTIRAILPWPDGNRIRFNTLLDVDLNQQDIRIVLTPSLF